MSDQRQENVLLSRLKRRVSISSTKRDSVSIKRDNDNVDAPQKSADPIKDNKPTWHGHFNFAPVYDDTERTRTPHENKPAIQNAVFGDPSNHPLPEKAPVETTSEGPKLVHAVPSTTAAYDASSNVEHLRRIVLVHGSAAAALDARIVLPASPPPQISSAIIPLITGRPVDSTQSLFLESSTYLNPVHTAHAYDAVAPSNFLSSPSPLASQVSTAARYPADPDGNGAFLPRGVNTSSVCVSVSASKPLWNPLLRPAPSTAVGHITTPLSAAAAAASGTAIVLPSRHVSDPHGLASAVEDHLTKAKWISRSAALPQDPFDAFLSSLDPSSSIASGSKVVIGLGSQPRLGASLAPFLFPQNASDPDLNLLGGLDLLGDPGLQESLRLRRRGIGAQMGRESSDGFALSGSIGRRPRGGGRSSIEGDGGGGGVRLLASGLHGPGVDWSAGLGGDGGVPPLHAGVGGDQLDRFLSDWALRAPSLKVATAGGFNK